MSNQRRAVEIIHKAIIDAPRYRGVENDIPKYIAHALDVSGLLIRELPEPHVTNMGGSVSATFPGAGCVAPTDKYGPQFIIIFGDEEASDATLAAGERLTAIKPEDLDKLIACLITTRNLINKEETK